MKKRKAKLKLMAKKVRSGSRFTKYFIVDKDYVIQGNFTEFSGLHGAKIALDESGLAAGASVVRASDGRELAFLRAYTIGSMGL